MKLSGRWRSSETYSTFTVLIAERSCQGPRHGATAVNEVKQ